MRIRSAHTGEAALLCRIARASKAHWGYSAAQMRRWHSELMITPESIAARPTWVVELDGAIAACCQLGRPDGERWTLENFWVLPAAMGRGIGRAMIAHVARFVASQGAVALEIDADPNAEPFYLACGARRVSTVPAPIDTDPERVRPQLRLAAPDFGRLP